jgi:hypothetical protein
MEMDAWIVASKLYQIYQSQHPEADFCQPRGVVVNRKTLRGCLLFEDKSALLPYEIFIDIGDLYNSS